MAQDPSVILTELLGHLGFDAKVEARDMEGHPFLEVETEDSSRLIGRQGQVLNDLQYLLNRLVQRHEPDSPRLTVDVGGYRAEAREQLSSRALEAAEKVVKWGDIIELEPMNSFERWVVHNALRDHPGVETRSIEVEGTSRKAILLRPKA